MHFSWVHGSPLENKQDARLCREQFDKLTTGSVERCRMQDAGCSMYHESCIVHHFIRVNSCLFVAK